MCGRFGFLPEADKWYERFEITNKLDKLESHYNIVPSMMVPVITKKSPKKATLMRWGFIPVSLSFFFEWMTTNKEKIPYCIKLKDQDIFAVAGLYSEIKDADRSISSFQTSK